LGEIKKKKTTSTNDKDRENLERWNRITEIRMQLGQRSRYLCIRKMTRDL